MNRCATRLLSLASGTILDNAPVEAVGVATTLLAPGKRPNPTPLRRNPTWRPKVPNPAKCGASALQRTRVG